MFLILTCLSLPPSKPKKVYLFCYGSQCNLNSGSILFLHLNIRLLLLTMILASSDTANLLISSCRGIPGRSTFLKVKISSSPSTLFSKPFSSMLSKSSSSPQSGLSQALYPPYSSSLYFSLPPQLYQSSWLPPRPKYICSLLEQIFI